MNARHGPEDGRTVGRRAPTGRLERETVDRPNLTVAVLTYRRNGYLAELLPLLLAQVGQLADEADARVLVVDNDPQAGAAAVVAEVAAAAESDESAEPAEPSETAGALAPEEPEDSEEPEESEEPEADSPLGRADEDRRPHRVGSRLGSRIRHVHEPVPGIVAGRNRALQECAGEDLLVFLDDDELPREGWLRALVTAWREGDCAAVTGPTPPMYAQAPNAWVAASGAFDSWRADDGARVPSADTGNLLLDLAVVRDLDLWFDPGYGLSGGEDSLFTRRLSLAGGVIRFATGAVVDKRVPPERATRAWVLRRSYRSGSSWARVRIDTASGPRLPLRLGYAVKGLGRAGRDGARAVLARRRGDTAARAVHEVSCRGGLGMVVGAFGVRVLEYSRKGDS